MFHDIVDGLFVPAGSTSVQYTQGFSLGDDNNLTADVLLISSTSASSSMDAYLQVSDDMQNWVPVGTASSSVHFNGSAPKKNTISVTNIVSAYGRFKLKAVTGNGLFKITASTKRT